MQIWTITYNDDYGIRTEIAVTQEEANEAAAAWIQPYWDRFFSHIHIPEKWQDAYEKLQEASMIDTICVEEHDGFPPYIADNLYVMAARRKHQREGEIEIDDATIVSHSEDEGAYVQAWVWVDDADLDDLE